MVILEVPVLGEIKQFEPFMQVCNSVVEQRRDFPLGDIILSDRHKIQFYFLHEYNRQTEKLMPMLKPHFAAVICIIDVRDIDSFKRIKQFYDLLFDNFAIPTLFYVKNADDSLIFTNAMRQFGYVLDKKSFIFFAKKYDGDEIKRVLIKMLGMMSLQDGNKK
jgi:hypothetical protein